MGIKAFDSEENLLYDQEPKMETGPGHVKVFGKVDRLTFYTDNTDGFAAIFTVYNNGNRVSFNCANCQNELVELDRLYLDLAEGMVPFPGVAMCPDNCDFYLTSNFK